MTRLLLVAALAGCATSPVRTGVGDDPVRTATISAPSPVEARPHTVPKASRTRPFTGLTAPGSGSLLDVTCYTHTGHRTASGKWPQVGMAASNTHPFGTRLLVDTVGAVTVEDRIGHSTDLDLYGLSESYCRQFGRQHLLVQVIR